MFSQLPLVLFKAQSLQVRSFEEASRLETKHVFKRNIFRMIRIAVVPRFNLMRF